jgi:CCR4-NOT transcriptional regulation complex NOT5 subunit
VLSFEDDCLEPDVQFPECLKTNRQFEVNANIVKRIPDKGLFYMFYNMPFDKQQVEAAKELEQRGWMYNESNMRWYRKEGSK